MTTEAQENQQWVSFRHALERAIGVPLGQYKEPQMKRRLASIMGRRGFVDWVAFESGIAHDGRLLGDVRDTLTINVSEFFRQADRFEELRSKHIPNLLKDHGTLKFWSAGCSDGCEPYTLAMILDDMDPKSGHSILATDVDLPILARAKAGKGYPAEEVRSIPRAILAKHMTFDGSSYAVNESLKRRITFRRHDLLTDAYPTNLDVILCRNVVIYFTDEAKQHIYSGFARALRPGGLLFVGGSEMIMRSREIGFHTSGTSMYYKAA